MASFLDAVLAEKLGHLCIMQSRPGSPQAHSERQAGPKNSSFEAKADTFFEAKKTTHFFPKVVSFLDAVLAEKLAHLWHILNLVHLVN